MTSLASHSSPMSLRFFTTLGFVLGASLSTLQAAESAPEKAAVSAPVPVAQAKAASNAAPAPAKPTAAPIAGASTTPMVTSKAAAVANVSHQSSSRIQGVSFDKFRSLAEKNIFNPNRYGRSSRGDNTVEVKPVGDSISFVGTMDYAKGTFAFFDSNNSNFRKVIPVGGTVAEFTLKQISPTSIELTREGKPATTLTLTQQLSRPPEGGEWSVSTSALPISSPAASSDSSSKDSGAAPAIPADASDILKRLMEKRQKQLKE